MPDKSIRDKSPDKARFRQNAGIDLVMGNLHDHKGRRPIDRHPNGGTFTLGQCHAEPVACLKEALDHFDRGNHWSPSLALAALSKAPSSGDEAARILQTIPATYGLPLPNDGDPPDCKALCDK